MKAGLATLGSDDLTAPADSMATGLGATGSGTGATVGAFSEPAPNEIELPEPPDDPVLLTVHVSLDNTDLQVWRRLTVPGALHLDEVYDVLQAAMGWTDSHLHRFQLGDALTGPYFLTEFDLGEGQQRNELLDEVRRLLADAGWRTDTRPLERLDVMRATSRTCHLLDLMLSDVGSTDVPATLTRRILRHAD